MTAEMLGRPNEVARALASALPGGWLVEGDGEHNAHAYQDDPRDVPPTSEGAASSISVMHDGSSWWVEKTGWNDMRGMWDLEQREYADSMGDAVSMAARWARKTSGPAARRRSGRVSDPEFDFGFGESRRGP
jgi:hypothetical protein